MPIIEDEFSREHPDLCLLLKVDWGRKRTNGVDAAKESAGFLHLNMAYGTEFEELGRQIDAKPAYIGQATLTLADQLYQSAALSETIGFLETAQLAPLLPIADAASRGRADRPGHDLTYRNHLLVVYHLHLESRSAGSIQMEQLNEVLSDLQGYPPGTPAIIGGDLNSKYSPSVFLTKMEQAGFRSVTGQWIERSHAIARDWIYVRGPFDVEDREVNRDFKGSDHYPIVALVRSQVG